MKNYHKILIVLSLFSTALSLTSCALNDQYLLLDPKIDITSSKIGSDKTIELTVFDKRETTKLGEIKDVHKDVFNVELKRDFTNNLGILVSEALEKQGFKTGSSVIKMSIFVEKLRLSSKKYPLTFKTDLEAVLSVEIQNESENYGNRLRIITTKQTAGPPYAGDSNELVNEAVSTLLTDMLNSEKLINVITK